MKKIAIFIICIFLFINILSQIDKNENDYFLKYQIVNNDTIYFADIDPIYISPKSTYRINRELEKYRKLVYNVKKVYPFAIRANQLLLEVNSVLDTIKTDKKKKEYVDSIEQMIKDQFEDDLKKMTITQGKILIKLIDRETGVTSYKIVKDLRGNLSAFFWQTLARMFGSSLKMEYNPMGEDSIIENIIVKIKQGKI
jgi:hypothetical protein